MKKSQTEPSLSDVKDREALYKIWEAFEGNSRWLSAHLRMVAMDVRFMTLFVQKGAMTDFQRFKYLLSEGTPETLEVAADLLEGKIKQRRLRPGTLSRQERLEMMEQLAILDAVGTTLKQKAKRKQAISLVAERYGVSPRHVHQVEKLMKQFVSQELMKYLQNLTLARK
jgi:hypothetical protein